MIDSLIGGAAKSTTKAIWDWLTGRRATVDEVRRLILRFPRDPDVLNDVGIVAEGLPTKLRPLVQVSVEVLRQRGSMPDHEAVVVTRTVKRVSGELWLWKARPRYWYRRGGLGPELRRYVAELPRIRADQEEYERYLIAEGAVRSAKKCDPFAEVDRALAEQWDDSGFSLRLP